jgi:hypothetical protein
MFRVNFLGFWLMSNIAFLYYIEIVSTGGVREEINDGKL